MREFRRSSSASHSGKLGILGASVPLNLFTQHVNIHANDIDCLVGLLVVDLTEMV